LLIFVLYTKGYLGVTAHFFSNFKLKSVYLGVLYVSGRHTSEKLAAKLKTIFTKFNIAEKVVSMTGIFLYHIFIFLFKKVKNILITADHASNMKTTALELGIKYYGCFAHCLNLIVAKTIEQINLESIDPDEIDEEETYYKLGDLLSQCRKLVGSFNHSTQMTEELIKAQTDREENGKKLGKVRLIQDVVTRY